MLESRESRLRGLGCSVVRKDLRSTVSVITIALAHKCHRTVHTIITDIVTIVGVVYPCSAVTAAIVSDATICGQSHFSTKKGRMRLMETAGRIRKGCQVLKAEPKLPPGRHRTLRHVKRRCSVQIPSFTRRLGARWVDESRDLY